MNIVDITLSRLKIPLKKPFITALRRVEQLESVLVHVKTKSGLVALGEAPPTAAITGETTASIENAILNHIKPAILGLNLGSFEEIMVQMHRSIVGNTSAKAAVDMALYDLFAQRCGLPLFRLLGGARTKMETSLTISLQHCSAMVQDSLAAVAAGYRILKIKVGSCPKQDLERVKKIRQAVGFGVQIRVDANQGWLPKQAVRVIGEMEDAGLAVELVEQPVPACNLDGMAFVTSRVATPILADESVFSARDAIEIIQKGAADFLNIKLMKTGGIYKALQVCAAAETYGVPCMIGCMLESRLAVSAAAHLAGGKHCITMMDLDGPALCASDPFTSGPSCSGPEIELGEQPGIGIVYPAKEPGVMRKF